MTTSTQPAIFIKPYRDSAARLRAEQNYQWLAGLNTPLRLPRLLSTTARHLRFEQITGRPAGPGDLIPLAGHLGAAHSCAYAAGLRHAQLNAGYRTSAAHHIPGFLEPRLAAVTRALQSDSVQQPALSARQAQDLLRGTCRGPAAFYKDANPRNFLIAAAGPVTIDFDDLTLAPFGYDLAKLIVTLAMTHGALPTSHITAALHAYRRAIGPHLAERAALTWEQLMGWAEIHHILTSRYLGRSGYRYSWHQLRPVPPPSSRRTQA